MSRLNIIKRAILIEVMLIMLAVSVNGMVVQIRETSTDGREKKQRMKRKKRKKRTLLNGLISLLPVRHYQRPIE